MSLTWKMTLGTTFLLKGFQLENVDGEEMPDLCINLGPKKLWIACVRFLQIDEAEINLNAPAGELLDKYVAGIEQDLFCKGFGQMKLPAARLRGIYN